MRDDFSQDSAMFPFSSTFGFGFRVDVLFCFSGYAKKELTKNRRRS